MIKAFIKGKNANDNCVSIEQYNNALKEADSPIEAGHFLTQEQVKEEMKTW